MLRIALAVALALMPAAIRLWRDRAFLPHLDDPALPERLLARRRSMLHNGPMALAIALFLVALRDHAIWGLALMTVALMWAMFRFRRRLLDESWSFAGYVSFFARLVIAAQGFWLLLMFVPAAAGALPVPRAIAASTLGVLLLAWNVWFSPIFRVVMRARPLRDASLAARFNAIAAKTSLPEVQYFEASVGGGRFANAIALPHTRRPVVVFSDTLLTQLDADESTGVAAHEIAHFEQYTPARLRRLAVVVITLIALAVMVAMAIPELGDGLSVIVQVAWIVVVIWCLLLIGRSRRRDETESDLRAVALTGDPEALVRGLTKIHALAQLPRRWAAEFEQAATHPSLARRIQAIRHSAGISAPQLQTQTITSRDGTTITLRDDAIEWIEKTGTITLPYNSLTELRVEPGASSLTLIAVGVDRQRRTAQIDRADLARLQQALDVVDVHLAPPVRQGSIVTVSLARWSTLVAGLASLALTQFLAAIVALLAFWRPTAPLMLAAGAGAAAAGAMELIAKGAGEYDLLKTPMLAIVAGVLMIMLGLFRRHDGDPRAHRWTRPIVIALGLIAAIPLLAASKDLLTLHDIARTWPMITVGLAMAAASMLAHSSTRAKAVAAVLAVTASATAFTASSLFLDLVARDPLRVVGAQKLQDVVISGDPTADVDLDDADEIWISPSAAFVAYRIDDRDERHAIAVARVGSVPQRFEADQAVFASDQLLVLMRVDYDETTTRLRFVALPELRTVVEKELQDFAAISIAVDPASGDWIAVGYDGSDDMTRVNGDRTGAVRDRASSTVDGQAYPIAAKGDRVFVQINEYAQPLHGLEAWRLTLRGNRSRSTLRVLGPSGVVAEVASNFQVDCTGNQLMGGDVLCLTYDGTRTHVFSADAATLTLTPRMTMAGHAQTNWIRGTLASVWPRRSVAIDLARGRVFHPPADHDYTWRVLPAEGAIGVASYAGDRDHLRIFGLK